MLDPFIPTYIPWSCSSLVESFYGQRDCQKTAQLQRRSAFVSEGFVHVERSTINAFRCPWHTCTLLLCRCCVHLLLQRDLYKKQRRVSGIGIEPSVMLNWNCREQEMCTRSQIYPIKSDQDCLVISFRRTGVVCMCVHNAMTFDFRKGTKRLILGQTKTVHRPAFRPRSSLCVLQIRKSIRVNVYLVNWRRPENGIDFWLLT